MKYDVCARDQTPHARKTSTSHLNIIPKIHSKCQVEMLTEAVQIPENFVPLAFTRLTELTLQELEVSFILHWSLLPSLIQSITILLLL